MLKIWLTLATLSVAAPALAQRTAAPPLGLDHQAALLAPPTASAAAVTIPRDTPVELMAPREISTADATAGEIFKLRVNKAIAVNGRVVVPVGTLAFGQVVSARDSGGLGKSGRMTAKLLHIQLGEDEIPLEGETSAKGTGAGSAGVAILFTGWAGFFHRGNNAKIKAGEILVGFVAADTALDLSGPTARRAPAAAGSAGAARP
jgi:hypothetical protein